MTHSFPTRRAAELSGTVDETFDIVAAAPDDAEAAVRFRRGWMLGDGTGAGKGRQVAGVLLDNWLQGRCRAVWVSKSDRSEEHTSELQSLMRNSYAVFCLKKKKKINRVKI